MFVSSYQKYNYDKIFIFWRLRCKTELENYTENKKIGESIPVAWSHDGNDWGEAQVCFT